MVLLSEISFALPLQNPVIIFSLVLFIILFAPILFNKVKVPHVIGLILAGVIVGPYGLNLLLRDSSIVLFGTVGLLYIMFLAGLEIDLTEFKKNRNKIMVFGLTTFILPLAGGVLASYYVLGFSVPASVLLASMFSTHTLISYPITSKFGISRNRAVNLTVGGTMITDVLALIILAVVAGMTKEEVTSTFWATLGIKSLVFVGIVFFLFPVIIRWFFKTYNDSVSQYIFVLAIVFLASFLAEAAGLEAIIGAFFSGLVLNTFVPHTSPLMNRIDFVGNALFIPFFLLSVGMLVDITVLTNGWGAFKVAGVIVVVAVVTKYLAAWITQKIFKLSKDEGMLIFGLSTSHAAATLAIILVGYNIIIGETLSGEPIRLLNEDVLNGTILLILVSCAVSSFVVEKTARRMVAHEDSTKVPPPEHDKILISLGYPEIVTQLVDFALMLKPLKSKAPVLALHVVSDESDDGKEQALGKKMLEAAINHGAATENVITPISRFDTNVGNGMVYTIKEQGVSDLIIGLHSDPDKQDFLGPVTEHVLSRTSETIFVLRSVQPYNTIKKMVVAVTPCAELEAGFAHWFSKLVLIGKEAGIALQIHAHPDTITELKRVEGVDITQVKISFEEFERWEDFLIFSRELNKDDMFVIVSSREGFPSFQPALLKLPYYLSMYFKENNFIILYPKQIEVQVPGV